MPFDIPKCLANDPDVRRMAEKVINLTISNSIIMIIIVMMGDQVRKEEERKARLERELREKERQLREIREREKR